MKRLMIALSAAAMAFGLYAAEGTIASENFNGATAVPDTITNPGESSISTAFSWSKGGEVGEPDEFRDGDEGENLAIKTPFNTPATWGMEAPQSMAGLYFDSLVKFTACDEDPDMTQYSDAKLVVWVKEIEGDGGAISKKLFVTAGFLKADETIEAKNYDCGLLSDYGIADDNDWCRLTIKAKPEITRGAQRAGFIVFVNGNPVTISTKKDIGEEGSAVDSLTNVDKQWAKNDRLFPSLIAAADTIQSVGFAGQGAVDDLVFTTGEPTSRDNDAPYFAKDLDPVVATVGDVECADVDAINAAIAAAADGATVTLLDNVTGDLKFDVGAAFTLDLNGFTLTGDVSTEGVTTTIGIYDNSTAKTGKIDGEVTIDRDEVITLYSGKISVDAMPTLEGNVVPANGYEFTKDGNYWTVAEITEDGTTAKPWKINTAQDFIDKLQAKITAGLAADHMNFVQTADIVFDGTTVWTGIGTFNKTVAASLTTAFQGVYDGNGKTIDNLVLGKNAKTTYLGFFAWIHNGTVKDLTIKLKGFDPALGTELGSVGGAALAGRISGTTTLDNVVTKMADGVTAIHSYHNAAGLAVIADGGQTIQNCVNEINWVGHETKVAGMVCVSQNQKASTLTFTGCQNKGTLAVEGTSFVDGDATKWPGGDGLAGFVSYQDTNLKFENCASIGAITDPNVNKAKKGSFVGHHASGNVTGSGNTAVATCVSLAAAADGFNFATVNDGVATFVADSAAVNGANLKVMTTGNTITLANVGDVITLDTSLATATVTTTAVKAYVAKVDSTYTVVEKQEAEFTISIDPTEAEWTDSLTFPTPTITGTTATGSWSPNAIVEPEAGTTKTYTYTVTVAETETTLETTKSVDFKVWKKAASGDYPPDWPKGDDDAIKEKFKAWFKAYGDGADLTAPVAQQAFLLNCPVAEVEAEKAAFKITSITQNDDGTWAVAPTVKNTKGADFNGTVEVKGSATVDSEYSLDVTNPQAKFFKAVLKF